MNAKNDASWTALILASCQGHIEVVRLLLAAKANAKTGDGEDALQCAQERRSPHVSVRGGRLTVWNDVRMLAVSRLIEVTCTAVPAGTLQTSLARAGSVGSSDRSRLLSPVELRSVAPNAVKDDGHFSGDSHLAFFRPMRLTRRSPQTCSGDHRLMRWISALAASKR